MQYKVISVDDIQDLAANVNAALADGWKLHGGVAVAFAPSDGEHLTLPVFAQAMVKEDAPQAMPVGTEPTVDEMAMLGAKVDGGGDKIRAIKAYRQRTGLGLKESKDAIDDAERRLWLRRM